VASVRVGGADVAYDVQGDGDPVVLLHPTGGSRAAWTLLLPTLTPTWRIVMPEFSGAGETVDDGAPLDVDGLVAQAAAVIDALEIERYHLAGYSLGAALAAALAAEHGDRVRSLVLVCGWATSGPRERLQFDVWQRLFLADRDLFTRYLFSVGMTPAVLEAAGENVEAFIAMTAMTLAPGTDRHADLDGRLDVAGRLARTTAPTLVIGGTLDQVLPIEHSHALAEGIAGSRLLEVDRGHLYPLEAPDELGATLAEFFAANP
jgi:pimeloyl-ACP methyl ester carboxylesterase